VGHREFGSTLATAALKRRPSTWPRSRPDAREPSSSLKAGAGRPHAHVDALEGCLRYGSCRFVGRGGLARGVARWEPSSEVRVGETAPSTSPPGDSARRRASSAASAAASAARGRGGPATHLNGSTQADRRLAACAPNGRRRRDTSSRAAPNTRGPTQTLRAETTEPLEHPPTFEPALAVRATLPALPTASPPLAPLRAASTVPPGPRTSVQPSPVYCLPGIPVALRLETNNEKPTSRTARWWARLRSSPRGGRPAPR
jgi:hypothetical protein